MMGTPRPDCNNLKLECGECAEAHEDNKSRTNSTNAHGIPAVTLHPDENATCSYWFLSLVTGEKICRGQWLRDGVEARGVWQAQDICIPEVRICTPEVRIWTPEVRIPFGPKIAKSSSRKVSKLY